MDLFEKVVEMATDLNPKAQIIVRNEGDGDWFIHYFIYDIENGHKTLYQKYPKDLTKALKEIKKMLEASKQGALLLNKDIKSIKINEVEEKKIMKTHELKILPQYFKAVQDGSKPFEIRENDRDYKVGDTLILQEYQKSIRMSRIANEERGTYTGQEITKEISYIYEGGQYGLEKGHCALGLKDVEPKKDIHIVAEKEAILKEIPFPKELIITE